MRSPLAFPFDSTGIITHHSVRLIEPIKQGAIPIVEFT